MCWHGHFQARTKSLYRDVLFTQPPARATKLLVPTPQGRRPFITFLVRRQNSSLISSRAPASHLAITSEGYSRRYSKALTEKSMAKIYALGAALRLSLGGFAAGLDSLGKNTGHFLVGWQSLRVLIQTKAALWFGSALVELVTDQSSAHIFAQPFDHSLHSE